MKKDPNIKVTREELRATIKIEYHKNNLTIDQIAHKYKINRKTVMLWKDAANTKSFLEKEKVLKFNRFYLLFSLVFAYAVPFISLTIPNFEKSKPNLIIGNAVQQQAVFVSNAEQNNVNWMFLIPIIYVSVALLFLVKALFSVYKILNLKGQTLMYQHQKIKILEKEIAPFSFLNKIYFVCKVILHLVLWCNGEHTGL